MQNKKICKHSARWGIVFLKFWIFEYKPSPWGEGAECNEADEVFCMSICLNRRYCITAPHPSTSLPPSPEGEGFLSENYLRFGAFDFGKLPHYFTQKRRLCTSLLYLCGYFILWRMLRMLCMRNKHQSCWQFRTERASTKRERRHQLCQHPYLRYT